VPVIYMWWLSAFLYVAIGMVKRRY